MNSLKKINKILILLLIVTFFKELLFAAIIPIWHTPDEQAHFAQVAYFAEQSKMPSSGFDLNKEIFTSEQLLGTERDIRGNNKFTFHPEYKIDYSKDQNGPYELFINNLSTSYRHDFVKYESANYPPLYYWIGGAFYYLVYGAGLIDRVFMVRLWSILLGVATTYLVFLIGKRLFKADKQNSSQSELLPFTLAILVSFQPMLSFVFAGVTSDNLTNFLFTVIIYLGLVVVDTGWTRKTLVLSFITVFALYLTKPQFIFAIPILIMAWVLHILVDKNKSKKVKALYTGLTAILLAVLAFLATNNLIYLLLEKIYPQSFNPTTGIAHLNTSFLQFFKESLLHTKAEVIPWYWGVFDWLGVVFPIEIIRILNRVMLLAGLGVIIKLLLSAKNKTLPDLKFIFLILASAIYFFGIVYYNYIFTLSHGYPFGIQGRYYFPLISAHMAILLVGLITFVPNKWKLVKELWIKIISLAMITLNFFAVWLISKTYFDVSSLDKFLSQVSQYKPSLLKGDGILVIFVIYLITLIAFLFFYLRLRLGEKE